ncbi:transglutaminase-like cysteine peptidase [Allomesorhizobium camelthorni]|uniref:Transglutaminase-like cysteine peptidase n=1 Tax=Allomesorhizobium camelthorni TaxID=475069 RepID=A0A6G4W9I1_9HYPH|nr:transglutaminase-like cysteine peptidase [Mesorhizobium camelthorni]NGO51259.1 transglutaminase-like cysteine peptidase [Mesorhizobium camelthorni]
MDSSARARRATLCAGIFSVAAMIAWSASPALAAAPMLTGGLTSQPIGHYEFCKVQPAECAIRTRDLGPETMTGALWKILLDVNVAVNRAIRPMNDFDIYGKDEVWAYPNGVGDCEDYVLEKRRSLKARGLSLSNLLITVVRKADGEGHAILTVRTDKGDFVLDNLSNVVRQWDNTGYRFLKRQASDHTGRWVSIREGQAPLVGSVQ